MKYVLFIPLIFSLVLSSRAEADADDLTPGDLHFFFERAGFNGDGNWEFRLSNNAHGMLWRIITSHSDVTGACEAGQLLTVSPHDQLSIKGKGFELDVGPNVLPGYNICLKIKSEKNLSAELEVRRAMLVFGKGSAAGLAYPRD